MIEKRKYQKYSEIGLFNKIGFIAEELGHNAVYFKIMMPKVVEVGEEFKLDHKYMHCIHLYKNEGMKISIYYDKHILGSMLPEQSYFELYDGLNIERFLDTKEDRSNLINRLSKLLQ
jgi:hypothetical protein